MNPDCYILKPDGIFSLAGLPVEYTQKHESPDYVPAADELEIHYYRWEEFGHFVAAVNGLVAFDPMGMSNSVQLGELKSKRIFKVL